MNIVVVTPIPTPYRDGFWSALAARNGVDLTVYYCAAGKSDRPWMGDWERKFQWEVLSGKNLLAWNDDGSSLYYNPVVCARLGSAAIDAVLIGGYNHPTMLMAIRDCIRLEIPYFLMSESHLQKTRSKARRLLKDRLVRWVVDNMAGGFPTGSLAEEYLLYYGAQPETLMHLPNAPNVLRIKEETDLLRENRERLRQTLGLTERPVILFVGRLIEKKGAKQLIDAVIAVQKIISVDLVIVGDGPNKTELEQQARQSSLKDRIHFAGFVEPSEIAQWYAAADLFVLPSQETWGVVVLEAMAAGLPVVVSEGVGCHPDVVGDSHVGAVIEHGNVEELTNAILVQLNTALAPSAVLQAWQPIFQKLCYQSMARNAMDHIRVVSSNTTSSIAQAAR